MASSTACSVALRAGLAVPLAAAGAGIVGAGIGGPMADSFNNLQPGLGYLVIFAIYAGLFLISIVTLVKVKVPAEA